MRLNTVFLSTNINGLRLLYSCAYISFFKKILVPKFVGMRHLPQMIHLYYMSLLLTLNCLSTTKKITFLSHLGRYEFIPNIS